jgi:hypothetical protein
MRQANTLIIFGIAAALIFLWNINRRTMEGEMADPAALAAKFEETVFGNEFGADYQAVIKWDTSINISVSTTIPPQARQDLEDIVDKARKLTGIDVRLSNDRVAPNIGFHYAAHAQFVDIIRHFDPTRPTSVNWTKFHGCYFSGILEFYKFTRAIVVVANDLGKAKTRSCIFEEFYQGLGPGKDSTALLPSITSSDGTQTELSINDKIILRAHYDDRITPGMPRVEAMAIARRVIADLVTGVPGAGRSRPHPPALQAGQVAALSARQGHRPDSQSTLGRASVRAWAWVSPVPQPGPPRDRGRTGWHRPCPWCRPKR